MSEVSAAGGTPMPTRNKNFWPRRFEEQMFSKIAEAALR